MFNLNIIYLTLVSFVLATYSQAQTKSDSSINLQPIDLKIHFGKQSLLSSSVSAHFVSKEDIKQQQPNNLLNSFNLVPGVRMEERSPGSFRLAIRGSLIRSPFGIRNTKIYLDEFPLTDAAGNSYLNLIDAASIQSITVIKGPDGSLYGANSGGVIKIEPNGFTNTKNKIELNLLAGSYGTFQQTVGIEKNVNEHYQFSITQSFIHSDGYRENTELNKKTIQTSHKWNYNLSSELKLFAFYTDLGYETPGALTLKQYEENPKQARPAAGSNPGALEQMAAIYNKTFFVGLSHTKIISDQLNHNIAIYSSKTDFENPFITNYEFRDELNLGIRSYISWNKKSKIQMQLGFEASWSSNEIQNFENNKGITGLLQAEDKLRNESINLFYRSQFEILNNWNIEGSIGVNINKLNYRKIYPSQENGSIHFKNELMPRLASNYVWNNMAFRVSYSKGYSTPTLSEIRSSDNIINTSLQAEKGNNYEVGYRIKSIDQKFLFDFSYYQYYMKNGIIRQTNDFGVEYFSNIGQMNQKGVEAALWYFIPIESQLLNKIQLQSSISYNHYRFGHYIINDIDLINNKITAVPDWIWTNSLQIKLFKQFDFNIYYNYTSSSPLDDANTVFANKFNLLQSKLLWDKKISTKVNTQIYFGLDNVLNEKYSLGNDINAFGGRYYNAAPLRNFYAGIKIII